MIYLITIHLISYSLEKVVVKFKRIQKKYILRHFSDKYLNNQNQIALFDFYFFIYSNKIRYNK